MPNRTAQTHTPGPWKTKCVDTQRPEERYWLVYRPEDDRPGFSGETIAALAPDAHDIRGFEVAEANARLIAAAPDLLEAAKELRDAYLDAQNHPNPFDWLYRFTARLSAAIARATGEQT